MICPHCDSGSFALKYPLFETKNFRVVCDVHPLTEGHLLIIPKRHLSCVGEFNQELFTEFNNLYKKFSEFIKKEYGKISTFEHGKTGQTVFHSHVHLLPFVGKVQNIIQEGQLYLKKIYHLSSLREIYQKEKAYLFFSLDKDFWLVDIKLGKSRFFRDRFALALGRPERGNWKEMSRNTEVMLTVSEEINNLINRWQQYSQNR